MGNAQAKIEKANQGLRQGAKEGDVGVVKKALVMGARINAADEKTGWTALLLAGWYGRIDAVKLLVERGANKEAADNVGRTPLIAASKDGHLHVSKYLVEKGALTEARQKDGKTPLICAALYGRYSVVKFLLEDAGVNKNAVDHSSGRTALIWAAHDGHLNVVKLLVQQGAKAEARDEEGWTALMVAAQNDHLDVCKYLVTEAGVNVGVKNKDGKTAQDLAMTSEKILELLQDAATMKPRDAHQDDISSSSRSVATSFKLTAAPGNPTVVTCKPLQAELQQGAKSGDISVVEKAITAGGKIDAADIDDEDGKTALIWAASYGRVEMCKYLVKMGANTEARDKHGWTALMSAASNGRLDVCKELVEKGVRTEARDTEGKTALMWASYHGRLDVCKYLVEEAGVNVTVKSKEGKIAFDLAKTSEMREFLEAAGLRQKQHPPSGGSTATAFASSGGRNTLQMDLEKGAKSGDLALVEDALASGAKLDAADEDGWTALIWAAWYGHLKVCEFLVDGGASAEVRDTDGKTPLMWAASHGHLAVCKYLIETGVSVATKSKEGSTAQDVAKTPEIREFLQATATRTVQADLKQGAKDGNRSLVEKAVNNGAKFDAVDEDDGKTALIWAAAYGHFDVCKFLVDSGASKETRDLDGWSALMWAASNGRLDVCKYLVQKGANAAVRDRKGKTPLMWASFHGRLDVCKYLVEAGVNVAIKNREGETAADLAKRPEIREFLQTGALRQQQHRYHNDDISGNSNSSSSVTPPAAAASTAAKNTTTSSPTRDHTAAAAAQAELKQGAKAGDLSVVEKALTAGARIDAVTGDGWTALIWAAIRGHLNVCKYLVGNGASTEIRDRDGWSALMWASSNGHLDVCKYLVCRGSDKEAANKNGQTALIAAAECGHLDVCKYLVEKAGVNAATKNKEGKSALDLAKTPRVREFLQAVTGNPITTYMEELLLVAEDNSTTQSTPATKTTTSTSTTSAVTEAASGNHEDSPSAQLSAEEREAITEIIKETSRLGNAVSTQLQVCLARTAHVDPNQYPTVLDRQEINRIKQNPNQQAFWETCQGLFNSHFSAAQGFIHGKFTVSGGSSGASLASKAAGAASKVLEKSALPVLAQAGAAMSTGLDLYNKKKGQKQYHCLEALVASFNAVHIAQLCEKLARALTLRVYVPFSTEATAAASKEKTTWEDVKVKAQAFKQGLKDVWQRTERSDIEHLAIQAANAGLSYIKGDCLKVEPSTAQNHYDESQYNSVAEEVACHVATKLRVSDSEESEPLEANTTPAVITEEEPATTVTTTINHVITGPDSSSAASPVSPQVEELAQMMKEMQAKQEAAEAKQKATEAALERERAEREREKSELERLKREMKKVKAKVGDDDDDNDNGGGGGGGLAQCRQNPNATSSSTSTSSKASKATAVKADQAFEVSHDAMHMGMENQDKLAMQQRQIDELQKLVNQKK